MEKIFYSTVNQELVHVERTLPPPLYLLLVHLLIITTTIIIITIQVGLQGVQKIEVNEKRHPRGHRYHQWLIQVLQHLISPSQLGAWERCLHVKQTKPSED